MSTLSHAAWDSRTMLRRSIRYLLRYPSMLMMLLGMPVVFLLLFVYVFGGTIGDGLGGPTGGRGAYVDHVVPGIVLMTIGSAATSTAVAVATDMTSGIIARFRTMAIFRPSILIGHVVGSVLQSLFIVAAFVMAVTWLATAMGLGANTPEAASNAPMTLMILPFLGSGFVPTESMPAWLGWFAEYQPFTPAIETLRGLLMGTGIGTSAVQALAWSLAITVGCFLPALRRFNRPAG